MSEVQEPKSNTAKAISDVFDQAYNTGVDHCIKISEQYLVAGNSVVNSVVNAIIHRLSKLKS